MNRNNKAVLILAAVCSVAVPVAGAPKDEGFLVLRRGAVLEAMRFDGSERRVLRRTFSTFNDVAHWNISRDGKRVCFAARPLDVEFFNARAGRSYLFVLDHAKPAAQVLLRAYGAKGEGTEAGVTGSGYLWPSFDASGEKILVTEDDPGDHTAHGPLAIYNSRSRARTWNSGAIAAQLPLLVGQEIAGRREPYKRFYGAALSPDANHILCGAVTTAASTDAVAFETDFKNYLIHFDLKRQKVEVLASFDRQIEGITWKPNSRRFALSASNKEDMADIYTGELEREGLRRLTRDAARDFNPIWNRSGTRLFWLSNRGTPKSNRLFSMLPDGSRQRSELPRVQNMDSVRWAASLPSWRRYRDVEVAALVGGKADIVLLRIRQEARAVAGAS